MKLKNLLLALLTSVVMMLSMKVYAEDSFVPCSRLGRMQKCISVPLAEKFEDAQAKQFPAPAIDQSRIYIVRPYIDVEPKKKSRIYIDGQPVAEIAPKTYVVLDVKPGDHQITINTNEDSGIHMKVLPGQVYYVQYQLSLWINTISGELRLLDERNGQSQVRRSKKALVPE